jgi:hypothetical protein
LVFKKKMEISSESDSIELFENDVNNVVETNLIIHSSSSEEESIISWEEEIDGDYKDMSISEQDDTSDSIEEDYKSLPIEELTTYQRTLRKNLTKLSHENIPTWGEITLNWYPFKTVDKENSVSCCECGRKHIRYEYWIKNKHSGEEVIIGSQCIRLTFGKYMRRVVRVLKRLLEKKGKKEEDGGTGISLTVVGRRGKRVLCRISWELGLVTHAKSFKYYFNDVPVVFIQKHKKPTIENPTPYIWVNAKSFALNTLGIGQTIHARLFMHTYLKPKNEKPIMRLGFQDFVTTGYGEVSDSELKRVKELLKKPGKK